MLKAEVFLGRVYIKKVSGRTVPVRIQSESGRGYNGVNLLSGRDIFVKSAAGLRREATPAEIAAVENRQEKKEATPINVFETWENVEKYMTQLEGFVHNRNPTAAMAAMQIIWRDLHRIKKAEIGEEKAVAEV